MKENILSVKDLTIRYKDAAEPVIKNLSFELKQGEILCISGKSGAGKSTIVWSLLEMLDIYEGKGRKEEKKNRILELLDMVCLKEDVYYAYPHELSGGMKQRAAIAIARM